MSHFTKVATQFQDLDILQETLERLGFVVARKCQALDFYGRDAGVYPLVVPKQGRLSSDIYAVQDGEVYSICADSMDQKYLDSLCLAQRYAQVMVERFAAQHGLFVESTISEDGTVEYQLVSM